VRVLTIIPTYNELESLPKTLGRLRTAVPASDVLVVDDNSPDGTGQLADRFAAEDSHVHVLHRQGKAGLGAAYIAGFKWGLDAVEQGADLAMGSRWVPGGSVVNWPLYRQAISRVGSTYARIMLGVKIKDVTGGYRAFRRSTLEKLNLDAVDSVGYGFQVDLAWRVAKLGLTIVERPITFVERELGASKMSGNIVVEAMVNVTKWGLTARWNTLTGKLGGKRAAQQAGKA